MIRYISHNDIDTERWDGAVASSCYEAPYGYSWYLDLAAENWDALVEEDYRSVMPLPWKKKYMITCLYQPLNTQQLGIFSPVPSSPDLAQAFLEKMPNRFLLADICFNQTNNRISEIIPAEKRANFEICLEKNYQSLCQEYHTNTRRNLAKATQAGLRAGQAEVDQFLALKATCDPLPARRSKYERLHKMLTGLVNSAHGTISAAWAGDTLVAAVFWLFSNTRIIYLLPVSEKAGREHRAMFLLVDKMIREQSGSKKILDFEGSNIPSIARFFEGFGAVRKDYFRVTVTGPRLNYIIARMK